jgi:glutamate-ammonia-ligase adenylyltransferase
LLCRVESRCPIFNGIGIISKMSAIKEYLDGRRNLPFNLPDTGRAFKNIKAFFSLHPDYEDQLSSGLYAVSMLFSYSQFLANYSLRNPDVLLNSLRHLDAPLNIEAIKEELKARFSKCESLKDGMKAVRDFKKEKLIIVTIRDILKRATLQDTMNELSLLADAILSESLDFIFPFLANRYGLPEHNTLAVIGLGKLGPNELNYSSDVDLIFVYGDEGETWGILSPQGVIINKISAFEFYSKVVEEYCRFLSLNTEDGFCYRVDLRLRPQGQRGSLALSIRSYEEYYESWGQLWERAALIRARYIAGCTETGDEFLKIINPFIYRKYLGFDAIEEIRRMKSQVEKIKPVTLSRDIKRGFGGIREIEFFIQIFQLIYGGKEPLLRENSTLKALHRLLQKGFIGYEDFQNLSGSYIFLRTLEHRLQQLNDIQTHIIPSHENEIEVLAAKMGFENSKLFLDALYSKRHMVRTIYDSLLEIKTGDSSSAQQDTDSYERLMDSLYWEMDSPVESILLDELKDTKIKDAKKAIHCLTKIRNSIYAFQTLRGRKLLEELIPRFVDEAIRGADPDSALLQLVDFSAILASRESYLESISARRDIIATLNFIFSNSPYLSKIIMNNPDYLDSLITGDTSKKRLSSLKNDMGILNEKSGISTAMRLFRRHEEIRLGSLFLNSKIDIRELMLSLSRIADVILLESLQSVAHANLTAGDNISHPDTLAIIGFGKLGGMEITFNSDIDIIFICSHEPSYSDIKIAERLIRLISSYTKDGMAYRIDIRLRPDGSKGMLISSLEGIRNYYLSNAQPWELQALLKARPLNCVARISKDFMQMREDVLIKRSVDISGEEVRNMCERMQKELSKEQLNAGVFDIKYGTGGLAELEFFVQYMQIRSCAQKPNILVQNTFDAVKRLWFYCFLDSGDAKTLREAYLFYRTIETLLKLKNETILKKKGGNLKSLSYFLNTDENGFLRLLNEKKQFIGKIWERY